MSTFLIGAMLAGCAGTNGTRVQFVYIAPGGNTAYQIVENTVVDEQLNMIKAKKIGKPWSYMGHALFGNTYYDGQKMYSSIGPNLYIYDSITAKTTIHKGYSSYAMKKINGDMWIATQSGKTTRLCKIDEKQTVECQYEVENHQITDFYFNFDENTLFATGTGSGVETGDMMDQYKVVKYDLMTGVETILKHGGEHILGARLANICPGQFITSNGNIYTTDGEKIGAIIGTSGQQLSGLVNDQIAGTAAFMDYDNNLFEVYSCENNTPVLQRVIELSHEPDTFPESYSRESADNGEISMRIRSNEDFSETIGIQSVNLRSGKVEVYYFDEPVTNIHAVARFL
ncbi:hypothetical protein AwErysi_00040 [Erysipelotrichaceae bacterium]|nr:hypothetical protein AwErysi_00040 [Erysipelotrichaceae bacterium]